MDAEYIEEMLRSPGWKLFRQRLAETQGAKVREIILDQPTEKTERIRGFLQAIETVLQIPEIIMSESRKG